MHLRLRRSLPVALALCAPPAFAQQFLLTVVEGGERSVALVDAGGAVLARTQPLHGYGVGRFQRGGRWVYLGDERISTFDPHGERIGAVPGGPALSGFDAFGDGRFAVRDVWFEQLRVLDAAGGTIASWYPDGCAGGAESGLRTFRGGEVWVTAFCGQDLRRYDAAGVLLGEVLIPGGVESVWDDTCDDFAPAPDGTIWLRQGTLPTHAKRYSWTGALLTDFPVANTCRGIAVEDDGTLWARDEVNRTLLHYAPDGTFLGRVELPPSWIVESIVVRSPTPAGEPYCGPAVPNSTGVPGSLEARGYGDVPQLELVASDLPPGEPGLWLVARATDLVPGVGGGQGALGLGGPIGRYADAPFVVPPSGRVLVTVDLDAIPMPSGPVAAAPGETWYWQAWYRDQHPGPTSNLTDGVALTVE